QIGVGQTGRDVFDAERAGRAGGEVGLLHRGGLKNRDFTEYCGTASADFPGGPNTKGKPFGISNTNRMLSGIDGVAKYPGLIGGKNGYTTNAGNTLAEAARRDGHTILVTVMNPQENKHDKVYTEMRQLLDWGFSAAGRTQPIGTLDPAPAAAGSGKGASATGDAAGPGDDGIGALGWAGIGAAVVVAGGTGVLVLGRRRRRSTPQRGRGV
ncbi:D-alanyl-D-alanine carboxypeptidase, partial [Streptomyces hundungensis]